MRIMEENYNGLQITHIELEEGEYLNIIYQTASGNNHPELFKVGLGNYDSVWLKVTQNIVEVTLEKDGKTAKKAYSPNVFWKIEDKV